MWFSKFILQGKQKNHELHPSKGSEREALSKNRLNLKPFDIQHPPLDPLALQNGSTPQDLAFAQRS
jgi:hypothetical protein